MRLRTKSIVIASCQSISQITSILITVILVRMISQDLFGTYRQVFLIVTVFTSLFSLPIHNSLYYFLPKYSKNLWQKFLKQSVVFAFLGSCFVGLVMWFASGLVADWFANPPLRELTRVFVLYPIAAAMLQIIPAYLISVDKTVRAGLYSVVEALMRFSVVIFCVWYGMDLSGVFIGLTVASLLLAFLGIADLLSSTRSVTGPEEAFQLPTSQLAYCWPLWATAVVGVLNINLDKVLISYYFTPEMFAVFACGAIEIPIVVLVTHSINKAIMPDLVQHISNGEPLKALSLWQEGVRKSSLLLFPVFTSLLIISSEFVFLLFGSEYSEAVWPFRVYLFLLPLRVAIYSSLLQAMARTRHIAIGAVLALTVNLFLSVALLHFGQGGMLSFIGPSIATVFAQFLLALLLLIAIGKIMSRPLMKLMRWREMGQLLGGCLFSGLLAWPIHYLGLASIITMCLKLLVFGFVFLLFVIKTGYLTDDEKKFFLMQNIHK